MEKQTAVEEKQHCSICGKEGFVMRLQIPGGEAWRRWGRSWPCWLARRGQASAAAA